MEKINHLTKRRRKRMIKILFLLHRYDLIKPHHKKMEQKEQEKLFKIKKYLFERLNCNEILYNDFKNQKNGRMMFFILQKNEITIRVL
jgi:predicted nucleic acid-binding Zn ribbon protein